MHSEYKDFSFNLCFSAAHRQCSKTLHLILDCGSKHLPFLTNYSWQKFEVASHTI